MIIYLDNCCYNRPFDDQTQESEEGYHCWKRNFGA